MREKMPSSTMKSGAEKYVAIMKRLFVAFSVVLFLAMAVFLMFAYYGFLGCILVTAALALLWIVVYGFYAMRVSMGTVIGMSVTEKMLYLVTKRKVFTYDAAEGCIGMVRKGNRFIGTFETQDSRDKFIFYRRAPFSKYSDGQFTEEELRAFCPLIESKERRMH